MNTTPCKTALAALLCIAMGSHALAGSVEETRLLGSDREERRYQSYMPFTRAYGASGIVSGSLAESAAEAGVPASAMVQALASLGTVVHLEREARKGDAFYVRYEQNFTAAGDAIGSGKVLWVELRTQAKGDFAIHRFRTGKPEIERFYLSNGQAATAPKIRLPLQNAIVTSGFGLRADPFARPGLGWNQALKPVRKPAVGPAPRSLANVNMPTALALKFGLKVTGAKGGARPGGSILMMHDGVDLAAEIGTPIRAAGDGVVVGAEFKGGYGNRIEIEHDGTSGDPFGGFGHSAKLTTVYGHLLGFATGVGPGTRVKQGEVIGYVGSSGRSTGPHLHFEIVRNGKPSDPMIDIALQPQYLRGGELHRFKKTIKRNLHEREREREPD